ncbi:universal stress protein [Propylenella binzhouense]|nr:universal stress protein [Propylenella binzhouense]
MGRPRTVAAIVSGRLAVEPAVEASRILFGDGGGTIVGVMAAPVVISYALPPGILVPSFITDQVEANRRAAGAAEAELRRRCAEAGLGCDWREADVAQYRVSLSAGRMARTADLAVAPIPGADGSVGEHQVEDIVFESGRPVLVLPPGWHGKTLGRRALVAWDGGREAARAAFDALPLLGGAEIVRIASAQESAAGKAAAGGSAAELAAAFAGHGLPVETTEIRAADGGIASVLLREAETLSADLLVMGCFGHSRAREMILGGVTRDMLRNVTLPLLLSN